MIEEDVKSSIDFTGECVFSDSGIWSFVQVGEVLQDTVAEMTQCWRERSKKEGK